MHFFYIMKFLKKRVFVFFGIFSIVLFLSCSKDGRNHVPGCSVQLFDGDNFTDDYVIINGPGDFSNLRNLSGTNKDWDDEADALIVGSRASVKVWSKNDFKGKSATFGPNSEIADLDIDIKSLEISCP